VVAVACAGLLVWGVAGAAGSNGREAAGRTQLGIKGNAERFAQLTGQRSVIRHVFAGFESGPAARLSKTLELLRPIPMLAVKSSLLSPLDIARGRGDSFLYELNTALADFGELVYVRPMPEMNGHWNEYCAFNRDGSSRGSRYSTAAFRKAFARIAILSRGGSERELDRQLRKLRLPGVDFDLQPTKARMVWNPQGYGAPDIPANSAKAYFPGNAYVDVVANDLYRQATGAAWEANEALYRAHPGKPYAIAEWGLWGMDDPAFVERMAAFVKTHPRLEFLSYFNSERGSIWDLETKPRSRAAYRTLITPLGR